METYNASEGFFAVQNDPNEQGMLLLLDTGTFYEFVPYDEMLNDNPTILPSWEVEVGKTYAMIITSNNGLFRYSIGDTVRIESKNPLKIRITGRTKHYINAFGEELMVYNAEEAIAKTEKETGISVINYTAAPVYTTSLTKGRHQWLIEFTNNPDSEELNKFSLTLDSNLRKINSDYDANRDKDIFLAPLSVTIARR